MFAQGANVWSCRFALCPDGNLLWLRRQAPLERCCRGTPEVIVYKRYRRLIGDIEAAAK
jgi:hypothetical protein